MNPPFRVVITDFITGPPAPERQILGELAEVAALNATDEAELAGHVESADAIILYHCLSITRATLARLEQCKVLVRAGVGIDNVDHAFARTLGIPVVNIPDYGSEDVADSAIGMMLSLTRGISLLNSRLRAGLGPWSYEQVQPLYRLRNRTLGIVGLGRIGTAVALRAKALGMRVRFYDPFKADGYEKALGIGRADTLESLLRQAEVVSLHCPLTESTHHVINAAALALLPAGAYLVNTARGGLVDTAAVAEAIAGGRLAGAAFDVLEQEPPLHDPLVEAWKDPGQPAHHKVIINPHAAFYSEEGFMEIREKSALACRRALEGKPLRNVVN
jgi:D-3-phosphoglycerate dehydrogenase/C-terminal binding protein